MLPTSKGFGRQVLVSRWVAPPCDPEDTRLVHLWNLCGGDLAWQPSCFCVKATSPELKSLKLQTIAVLFSYAPDRHKSLNHRNDSETFRKFFRRTVFRDMELTATSVQKVTVFRGKSIDFVHLDLPPGVLQIFARNLATRESWKISLLTAEFGGEHPHCSMQNRGWNRNTQAIPFCRRDTIDIIRGSKFPQRVPSKEALANFFCWALVCFTKDAFGSDQGVEQHLILQW